jgi:hypothetical protein
VKKSGALLPLAITHWRCKSVDICLDKKAYKSQGPVLEQIFLQRVTDLPGNKALETTQNVLLGESFCAPTLHVDLGRGIEAQPINGNEMQGLVGPSVTTAVQSHAIGLA